MVSSDLQQRNVIFATSKCYSQTREKESERKHMHATQKEAEMVTYPPIALYEMEIQRAVDDELMTNHCFFFLRLGFLIASDCINESLMGTSKFFLLLLSCVLSIHF